MNTPHAPYTPPGSRTPTQPVDRVDSTADMTLERGFVASLRWLVSEGDARGVRRIAVELRALREALATLDETRAARDEYAIRANELDRELQAAMAMLGPSTAINGNGSLVQRLAKLRERLAADTASRRQLAIERDAWRAMCTLLTQTRARVHELLEEAENERDDLSIALNVMRARVSELALLHDDASRNAEVSRSELKTMRERLGRWSGTVERALQELAVAAGALARHDPPTR